MKNAIEFFPNLNALLAANASRKANSVFVGLETSLMESRFDTEFTGTTSYNEAEKLCRDGWFEKLDNFKEACSIRPINQLKRRVVASPVGYVPHVPNAIMGRPDCMIKTIMQKEKVAAVEIVVSTTISAKTKAEEVFKYSARILQAIAAIEASGTRVKIILCAMNNTSQKKNRGQLAQCFVTLKEASEKLSPARVYFPLVHPSMFRRITFRWLETCPQVTSRKFSSSYGYVQRINKLNLPPQLTKAKFINLMEVIKGDWDAKEILAQIK